MRENTSVFVYLDGILMFPTSKLQILFLGVLTGAGHVKMSPGKVSAVVGWGGPLQGSAVDLSGILAQQQLHNTQ